MIAKLLVTRPVLRLLSAALLSVIAGGGAWAATARGDQLLRTYRVAPPGVDPNGPSGEPSISADSRYVAFASEASNLGPRVGTRRSSNVYVFDTVSARAALISSTPSGRAPNGPSSAPAINATGRVVTFVSTATDLVPGVSKHVGQIYVRFGAGPVRLVSVGFGGQPNGNSSQPVVSGDGRYIAFTSAADNLVPGDDNAETDVFLADVSLGTIRRISVSSGGGQANGPSYNPSISADGRYVGFSSAANNLVSGDHNRVADVFVHDTVSGTTTRVSTSSSGRPQNAAVAAPFTQFSALTADGHYIVFDSDATNLVRGDRNGHTDVFRHSLISGTTTLVSQNAFGRQGNNDSFSPSISADGRITAFESFADNLAAPWAPNENVFAQDIATGTVLTTDVTPQGRARGPELDAQLLQRPVVSPDGRVVVFASGADDLVSGDYNGTDDLFVRILSPPGTSVVLAPPATTTDRRPMVEFRGTLPLVSTGLCALDGRRWSCPMGRPFRLPKQGRGTHVLSAYAAAPGTLFDAQGVTVHFTEA